MRRRKERGVFWIVSTHVLTTGFVMPFLASFATALLYQQLWQNLSLWPLLALALLIQLLAYVGGTYYSLSYLRRVAVIRRPLDCITPSIITFAVLASAALALQVLVARNSPDAPLVIGIWAAFYVIVTLLFAAITRRGLAAMDAEHQPRGFPVLPVEPVPPDHLDSSHNEDGI